MSDSQESKGRINPDRIEFEYDRDEGKVYYKEFLDCSDRSVPEGSTLYDEVMKDKELFEQKAAVNPYIDVVDVEVEVDNEVEMIEIVMKQEGLEAVAGLAGELIGFVLEEDEEMFYNKFKPFIDRANQMNTSN